jgi:hypothetical protein
VDEKGIQGAGHRLAQIILIGDTVALEDRMHLRGELHDHFGTRRHRLAAVAFNAMMEFYFAGLESEPTSPA